MKKTVLLFVAIVNAAILFAQPAPTANLTIFSEDGNKFFLILNGERQNNVAQTNIRVEELVQPYYSCKIIFEDKALGEISKSVLMVRDAENLPVDVTYKIKTDKNNGKKTLKFFSQEPVRPDYIVPSNVMVYHWGQPTPAPVVQQTTTTTTTTGTPGANVNVNMGGLGVGVNININDPVIQGSTTTTTTTTSSSSHTTTTNPARPGQPAPRPNVYGDCSYSYSMNPKDFDEAKATIKESSFEETKLSTAKEIISSNCLYADQVAQICKLFGFEDSKLDFAKYAYNHTIDRSNYFKVNNVFGFSSSKEELSNYIRGNR
jgi:hypothetical protein